MHRSPVLVVAALGLAIATAASAREPTRPYARQLDADSIAHLQPQGPHAITGLGDWVLSNGVLCAGITKLGRPGRFSLRGGSLVDLGFCGRADDQFVEFHPMLSLDRNTSPPFDSLVGEASEDMARIVVSGEADGLRYERRFQLDRAAPRELQIETVVTRTGPGASISTWGDLTMHPNASLRPFLATVGSPEQSQGFRHPGSAGESIRSRMAGIAHGDLHVMLADDAQQPQIAYGVHLASARLEREGEPPRPVPHFAIASSDFGMTNVFVRPPWLGSGPVGLLELAQVVFLDLKPRERFVVETRIYVGERSDVASITDFVHAEAPWVRGSLDDPSARIHVDTPHGHPVTQVRPDATGAFAFRLPPGGYRLRAVAPGGRSVERSLSVGPEGADAGSIPLGEPAVVTLPGPEAGPMRLVFVGVDGTATPELFDDLLGLTVGEQRPASGMRANSVSLAGIESDPRRVVLPPGRYRVIATRGPEYTSAETTLALQAGATVALPELAPVRAIETPGWLAADLHVHSGASFDSGLPARERVRSFVAQGGEVLVTTEHDRVFDIAPEIRALGLDAVLASVVGVEATSVLQSEVAPFTFGHANVLPLPHRPERFRGGAPTSQGVRLREMIAEVRALPGERLVQLNHPRSWTGELWDGSFFTHLSVVGEAFDPTQPLDAARNAPLVEVDPKSGLRDLDFDAIELLNGVGEHSVANFFEVRADWFALLRQGEIVTATANSDSHRLASPVGLPRTYVPALDDAPRTFDEAAFTRALREGRTFGTSGPFLEVDLSGARMGDRFQGASATLTVTSRAADWARADRARAYVNGRLLSEQPLDDSGRAVWALTFPRDAFVTVEVEGDPTPVFDALLPGSIPLAFSNPIFVDADADGVWTPPGLLPFRDAGER